MVGVKSFRDHFNQYVIHGARVKLLPCHSYEEAARHLRRPTEIDLKFVLKCLPQRAWRSHCAEFSEQAGLDLSSSVQMMPVAGQNTYSGMNCQGPYGVGS